MKQPDTTQDWITMKESSSLPAFYITPVGSEGEHRYTRRQRKLYAELHNEWIPVEAAFSWSPLLSAFSRENYTWRGVFGYEFVFTFPLL